MHASHDARVVLSGEKASTTEKQQLFHINYTESTVKNTVKNTAKNTIRFKTQIKTVDG